MHCSDHLIDLAEQLAEVTAGSSAADLSVHLALGLEGHVLAYTRLEAMAWGLLPRDCRWTPCIYASGRVFAACQRKETQVDGLRSPRHGQWGATEPLAMCGAVLRAWAKLAKG